MFMHQKAEDDYFKAQNCPKKKLEDLRRRRLELLKQLAALDVEINELSK